MKNKKIAIKEIKMEHEEKNILTIADTFLSFDTMSHKQLQKLCYYAQAFYYTLNDKPLFNSQFEAWVHGPVSQELFKKFKNFGKEFIPYKKEIPKVIKNNEKKLNFLMSIYRVFGDLTAKELEVLTKTEEPWKKARKNLKPWEECHNIISLEDMKDCYSKKLNKTKKDPLENFEENIYKLIPGGLEQAFDYLRDYKFEVYTDGCVENPNGELETPSCKIPVYLEVVNANGIKGEYLQVGDEKRFISEVNGWNFYYTRNEAEEC